MVDLRWARPEDLPAVARISSRCFPGYDEAGRLERIRNDPRFDVDDILVAEEDGGIVGGATVLPLEIWSGGVGLPAGGVASVQIDPDHRRRGIAQAVMKRILEAHYERGFCLSILYPYDPAFYRRLGYATIVHWIELRLRAGSLPPADAACAVRTATDDDLPGIIDCHRRSLPSHNGGLTRTLEFWKARVLAPARRIALFEANERVEGYFLYELHETSDHLQQVLCIREWVAPSAAAQAALLGYLNAQRAQCPETRLFAPADCSWPLFLVEPRSPIYANPECGFYSVGTTGTGPMMRVQDVRRLFAADRSFPGPPLTCHIRLIETAPGLADAPADPAAAQATVEFDGLNAAVTSNTPSAWLECDPGTMAQIYFAAVLPSDAVRWGAARVDSPKTAATLDRLFAQRAPFVHPLDYF